MGNEKEEDYLKQRFLNLRIKILVYINRHSSEGITVTDISNTLDKDYSYCHRIVSEMEENGVLRKVSQSKEKFIELTEKGKDLSDPAREFRERMDNF